MNHFFWGKREKFLKRNFKNFAVLENYHLKRNTMEAAVGDFFDQFFVTIDFTLTSFLKSKISHSCSTDLNNSILEMPSIQVCLNKARAKKGINNI